MQRNPSFYNDFKQKKLQSNSSIEIEFLESANLNKAPLLSQKIPKFDSNNKQKFRKYKATFQTTDFLEQGLYRDKGKTIYPRAKGIKGTPQKFKAYQNSIRQISREQSAKRKSFKKRKSRQKVQEMPFWRTNQKETMTSHKKTSIKKNALSFKKLKKTRSKHSGYEGLQKQLKEKFKQLKSEKWGKEFEDSDYKKEFSKIQKQGSEESYENQDNLEDQYFAKSIQMYSNKNTSKPKLKNIKLSQVKKKPSDTKSKRKKLRQKTPSLINKKNNDNPNCFKPLLNKKSLIIASKMRDKSFDRLTKQNQLNISRNNAFIKHQFMQTRSMSNHHRRKHSKSNSKKDLCKSPIHLNPRKTNLQSRTYQQKRRDFEALKNRMLYDYQEAVSKKVSQNIQVLETKTKSRRSKSTKRSSSAQRVNWKYSPLSRNLWNAMPSRSLSRNKHYSARDDHSPMILRRSFQIDRQRNKSYKRRSDKLFYLHQRKLHLREKKRLVKDAEAQQRELSECSFMPKVNSKYNARVMSDLPVEERLRKWRQRRDQKQEEIRHVRKVTAFLQAEQKICDCFDPLSTTSRRKMLQLEGIGHKSRASCRNKSQSSLKSEVSLEHRSDCSARLSRKESPLEDNFVVDNKKTSESIAKFLYQKEFARKKRDREKKLKEKFVELRSYLIQ